MMDKETLLKFMGRDSKSFNINLRNCLKRYLEQHPEDNGVTSLYKDMEYVLSFWDDAIICIDKLNDAYDIDIEKVITDYIENGSCPFCFGGDEDGHELDCDYGKMEKELEETKLALKLACCSLHILERNPDSAEMLEVNFMDLAREEIKRR